jgi:DNA polymerase-1
VPHQPRLFLIGSFGFIFRAYHARARSAAPPMRTSAGLSTEAVYIFNNMLRKLAKSYAPEYIAAVRQPWTPCIPAKNSRPLRIGNRPRV